MVEISCWTRGHRDMLHELILLFTSHSLRRFLAGGSGGPGNGAAAFPEQELAGFQLDAVAGAAFEATQDLLGFRQAAHQGPDEHLVPPFGVKEVDRDLA